MEFKLKPFYKNTFSKSAVLICSAAPKVWLQEIQRMEINLNDVYVFPVPSNVANELYGCLIVFKMTIKGVDIGKNSFFQSVYDRLFIPENTIIFPMISIEEMTAVFSEHYHVLHPEFGLVELNEEVNWLDILSDLKEVPVKVEIPSKGVVIPQIITSLRIETDEESILKQIESPETESEIIEKLPFNMKKVLKGNQKEIDKLLLYLDKNPEMAIKLAIPLDIMNTNRGDSSGRFSFNTFGSNWPSLTKFHATFTNFSTRFGSNFYRYIFILVILLRVLAVGSGFIFALIFFGILCFVGIYIIARFIDTKGFISKSEIPRQVQYNANKKGSANRNLPRVIFIVLVLMAVIFVELINSDHIDKSVSPLVYIISFLVLTFFVIYGVYKFFNFLSDTNFLNNNKSSNTGNAALLDSDRFSILRKKYEELAKDFISKKDYEKAAHIYLKLLKDNHKAAQVLEEGKLYQEAATIYLKYGQNKSKAAECFEKGRAYKEAIALYKELNQTEKVGDLYLLMHQKTVANEYFYKVVENYKINFQYVKAALVLRNKVDDIAQSQNLLFDGWLSNKDAANCLNNYFYNIDDIEQLKKEIQSIYKHESSQDRLEIFLMVIKKEYDKSDDLKPLTRDIAYEIVANRIYSNPQVASELIHFNKNNKTVLKDVMKFKINRRTSTIKL